MQFGVRECLLSAGCLIAAVDATQVSEDDSGEFLSPGKRARAAKVQLSPTWRHCLASAQVKLTGVSDEYFALYKGHDEDEDKTAASCRLTLAAALARLEVKDVEGSYVSNVKYIVDHMKTGLCAISAICLHLNLWGNPDYADSIRFISGNLSSYLHYDSSVAQALSIFSTPVGTDNAARMAAPSSSVGADRGMPDESDGLEEEVVEEAEEPVGRSEFSEPFPSLLQILDVAKTRMGSRLLRRWLQQPLRDLGTISYRLDVVSFFTRNLVTLANFRQCSEFLLGFPDMDGICK